MDRADVADKAKYQNAIEFVSTTGEGVRVIHAVQLEEKCERTIKVPNKSIQRTSYSRR